MARLTVDAAEALVAAALERNRTSPENARIVARALIAAEADGQYGHGLSRVPTYTAQAKIGKVDGFASPVAEPVRPGLLRVDAASGFAYPALDLAVSWLPEATRANGVAAAAIYRSHHCGVAGHVVERLAELGLVALLFANTPSGIAPWGGKTATFGTNPIAFACPLPERPALVVDLSLSKVARGKILAASQRDEPIPEGWAFDRAGNPTTDPHEALKGTVAPMGDAKGTALVLMVELLAAGLTGANYAAEASAFLHDQGPPPHTGQLILAIDPVAASGGAAPERFAALVMQIEAQDGARLPGMKRLTARAAAARDGLEVANALLGEIEAL